MAVIDSPPEPNQLEVTLLGPGRGECVVVHLGGGEWMIVDCCKGAHDAKPAPLMYLDSIGVDATKQVVRVVASHGHDDHIAGLGAVVEQTDAAYLVTSPALTREQFLASVEADAQIERVTRQSVRKEYRRMRAAIVARGRQPNGSHTWKYTMENQTVYAREKAGDQLGVTVLGLSPSSEAIDRSLQALASMVAIPADKRRLSGQDPNSFSVVLWIAFGDERVLLGADLENGPAGCGWTALVDVFTPDKPAGVFKIPHHGSENADSDAAWSTLVSEPHSIVAPFRTGSVNLPSDAQIARIRERSKSLHTTSPKAPQVTRPQRQVGVQLRGVAANVRPAQGRTGVIQMRKSAESDWIVNLGEPAARL